MKWGRWLAGLFGLAVLLPAAPAGAAGPAGFVVSPAFQQVQVAPDQPSVNYSLSITNRNKFDQNFNLSVVDFGALDESGGVAFLGAPTSELEHKYGLASWMVLQKNTVFVAAGQTAKITVTIDNRQSLAPGGHYGAVLAEAVNDPGTPTGDRVAVRQVLSSLVLVTKEGGANADLRLVSQSAAGGWWSLPRQVEQRFQNAGNVHVVPRGIIELKDPAGRVVRRAAINEGSQVILPETFRRYKTTLMDMQAPVWPGRYQLVSTYRYDGIDTTATLETSYWYAGQIAVWGTIVVLLVMAAILAGWLVRRKIRKRRTK